MCPAFLNVSKCWWQARLLPLANHFIQPCLGVVKRPCQPESSQTSRMQRLHLRTDPAAGKSPMYVDSGFCDGQAARRGSQYPAPAPQHNGQFRLLQTVGLFRLVRPHPHRQQARVRRLARESFEGLASSLGCLCQALQGSLRGCLKCRSTRCRLGFGQWRKKAARMAATTLLWNDLSIVIYLTGDEV